MNTPTQVRLDLTGWLSWLAAASVGFGLWCGSSVVHASCELGYADGRTGACSDSATPGQTASSTTQVSPQNATRVEDFAQAAQLLTNTLVQMDQAQAAAQQAAAAERDRLAREGAAQQADVRARFDQMRQSATNPANGAAGGPAANDDNPWANASSAKDPEQDFSGETCWYFTRPPVEDGTRMNRYENGSFVAYGKWMYECVNNRWVKRGSVLIYPEAHKNEATFLEQRK